MLETVFVCPLFVETSCIRARKWANVNQDSSSMFNKKTATLRLSRLTDIMSCFSFIFLQ